MAVFTTLMLLLLLGLGMGIKLFTHAWIPAWAAVAVGVLFVLGGQFLLGCFMLVFSAMMTRSHLGFLPIRDYSFFVSHETEIYSTASAPQVTSIPATAGRSS
jgi:hypothetical protein